VLGLYWQDLHPGQSHLHRCAFDFSAYDTNASFLDVTSSHSRQAQQQKKHGGIWLLPAVVVMVVRNIVRE